jgi:hypothetical protein
VIINDTVGFIRDLPEHSSRLSSDARRDRGQRSSCTCRRCFESECSHQIESVDKILADLDYRRSLRSSFSISRSCFAGRHRDFVAADRS